ncbi:MAG: addiction module protein [Planctomycetaceae bacterium]
MMAPTVEEVRAQALELSFTDRIALARELLEPHEEEISEREVDEMWAEVISRRLEELDRGDSIPVTRQEAMRRVDEALAAQRRSRENVTVKIDRPGAWFHHQASN